MRSAPAMEVSREWPPRNRKRSPTRRQTNARADTTLVRSSRTSSCCSARRRPCQTQTSSRPGLFGSVRARARHPNRRVVPGRPHRRRVPRPRQDGDRRVRYAQALSRTVGQFRQDRHLRPAGCRSGSPGRGGDRSRRQSGIRTFGDCTTCRCRRRRRAPSSPCCAMPTSSSAPGW